MIIPVGVSKRHVHLNEETFKELFGVTELPVRNELNQPGQYASTLTVDLKWDDKVIEHVRIVGPLRSYNQIELSLDECEYFGVNPPLRQSGDLEGSLPITIVGPLKEITLDNGLIRAERHIHMDPKTAEELSLGQYEEVEVYKDNNYLFNAKIKILDPSFIEIHIDTVEEKIYDLHQGNEVEFKKCGK